MTIDLITRVRYKKLYEGMVESASRCADGVFEAHCEYDKEKLPLCSKSYNNLARKSTADIVGVVEDDVAFYSKGWDSVVRDIFKEYQPDILGVVGSLEYWGGYVFDAGYPHNVGVIVTQKPLGDYVKVLSPYFHYKKVKVIDGMTMFINREWLSQNPFDEKFGEMFYYDIDLCLRSKNVGVTCDILVKHSTKGQEEYGKYPEKMKPIESYTDKFYKKHGINNIKIGDQKCAIVKLDFFLAKGQDESYDGFKRKYQVV